MAVITLNSNGSISLENYNNYSTESFGGAVKAILVKIKEFLKKIFGILANFFKKIGEAIKNFFLKIASFFSRKGKVKVKKEAVEQVKEKVEEVNQNIREGEKPITDEALEKALDENEEKSYELYLIELSGEQLNGKGMKIDESIVNLIVEDAKKISQTLALPEKVNINTNGNVNTATDTAVNVENVLNDQIKKREKRFTLMLRKKNEMFIQFIKIALNGVIVFKRDGKPLTTDTFIELCKGNEDPGMYPHLVRDLINENQIKKIENFLSENDPIFKNYADSVKSYDEKVKTVEKECKDLIFKLAEVNDKWFKIIENDIMNGNPNAKVPSEKSSKKLGKLEHELRKYEASYNLILKRFYFSDKSYWVDENKDLDFSTIETKDVNSLKDSDFLLYPALIRDVVTMTKIDLDVNVVINKVTKDNNVILDMLKHDIAAIDNFYKEFNESDEDNEAKEYSNRYLLTMQQRYQVLYNLIVKLQSTNSFQMPVLYNSVRLAETLASIV